MMDINKIGGRNIGDATTRTRTSGSDGGFGNYLEKARQNLSTQASESAASAAPAEAILSVQPAPDVQTIAVQQADRLLGALDAYSKALGDPGTSLKSVAPLVDRMEAEAGAAARVLPQLDSQGGLARIVNKAAVHASVEAFKFRRGDYV